jgi:thioesterase domain-containing protein
MALRLEEEGQKVAFLGVLDTWAMENTYNYFWFLEHYLRRLRALLDLDLGEQISFIKKKASDLIKQFQAISPPNPPNRLHDIYFPGAGFVPTKFPGRISVFRVRRQPINRIRDKYLGWESRAAEGVDVHVIPGRHEGLLREPYVRILAEQLERHLLLERVETGQEENGKIEWGSTLGGTLGVVQALSAVEESTRVFLETV